MQGLIALVFYSIGWYIKNTFVKENHIKLKLLVIFSLITMWIFSVLYGSVYLESCSIKLYPLEVLGSLGATIVLYIIVFNLSKNKLTSNILKPIQWCGKFSLAILCMHTLELYSDIIYSLICRLPSLSVFLGYGQIVICLILAYIVIRIPLLKNVYK